MASVDARSVKFWTIVGAIAAVLALPLSIVLAKGNESARPATAVPPTPTAGVPVVTVSSPSTESPNTVVTTTPAGQETLITQGPPLPTNVPVAELCNAPGASAYFCDSSGPTAQVGGRLFVYTVWMRNAATVPPRYDQILAFPANTCTKIVIEFAQDERISRSATKANVRVVQSTRTPVVASVVRGSIGKLTSDLDGGPFEIQGNATDGLQVYINGYAICDSPSGL